MTNSSKTQSNVRQEIVSYRAGAFTSKISVQPALFEAIAQLEDGRDEAYRWFASVASEGKQRNQPKISAYAVEQAYLRILPPNLMEDYESNLNVAYVRIKINGSVTTIAMPHVLLHYVVEKFNGYENAQTLLTKLGQHFTDAKQNDEEKKKDLSASIREAIIQSL